jgi:zeta-carotene desaturase
LIRQHRRQRRLQHVLSVVRCFAVSTRAVAPPPPPPTKQGTSSAKKTIEANTNSTAGFTSDAAKVSPKDAPLPSLFPETPNVPASHPRLKVAVIGAGLAGLSTAVELLDQGYQVDIYDQRPHVGGKVASWRDKEGNHIEMGLHVFFGCYFNLFRLMAKAGALENLLLKDHAHTFVNEGGDVRLLDFRAGFGDFKVGAPFHGLKAFFTTPQLSLRDKAQNALALGTSPVVRAVVDPEGGMADVRKLDGVSFKDWFMSHGARWRRARACAHAAAAACC